MPIFDKILVPIDGSRPSEVGSDLAIELAKAYGGSLVFVNIVDTVPLVSTLDYAPDTTLINDEARANGERLVNAAIEYARTHGLTAEGRILDGSVLERLLAVTVECQATVVVMGSHGRGALARLLIGSTTDGLLRRSPVPVVVAPRGTPRQAT
jgi:nucleotide-binding universal stress UspA family protein